MKLRKIQTYFSVVRNEQKKEISYLWLKKTPFKNILSILSIYEAFYEYDVFHTLFNRPLLTCPTPDTCLLATNPKSALDPPSRRAFRLRCVLRPSLQPSHPSVAQVARVLKADR